MASRNPHGNCHSLNQRITDPVKLSQSQKTKIAMVMMMNATVEVCAETYLAAAAALPNSHPGTHRWMLITGMSYPPNILIERNSLIMPPATSIGLRSAG
jgi:hypothetical protein